MGPTPGTFGRAALGSCLAMAYVMWASKLDIKVTEVSVEVHADYDIRGMYGVADVPPGYLAVRYVVTVDSDAPEADIIEWLDISDAPLRISRYLH